MEKENGLTRLGNENVGVIFNKKTDGSKSYIFLRDLKDEYNGTSGYTKKVRGIEKAWKFLEQIFADERLMVDLKFYDIVRMLDKFNLGVHTYCAVD